MFDLSNLNDYEFELLCKDIMQRLLGKSLHTFSRGIDGGIDICDSAKNSNVIIQAKHYLNSRFSSLKGSLKKEASRISELLPHQYFICTSLSLTKKNKEQIVDMFSDVMQSIDNVIDAIEISAFLEEEDNRDIVNKHYKLWLCASNVLSLVNNQNVFIDCSELMLDIEKKVSLFVETKSYFEAKNKLGKNSVIIITGAPGVGKTTISSMLLLFFANEGYSVRYATDNNISNIKKVLSQDPLKKEIILLDDFLGQHYLKIRDSQPNELKTLMSFVEKSPNKRLIMNSRITILNEAVQSSITFREIMERHEKDKYLIDLDKMNLLEKAKILYNHLYFNELKPEYFSSIKQNKKYFSIVIHKNYNPRIIEYVTKPSFYSKVSHEKYVASIMGKLENPEDVWRDEFRNRLEEIDRILVNTLYSLTDGAVRFSELETAFNKRIRNEGRFDTSTNPFRDSLIRLTNSVLKSVEDRSETKISVINPSVNDYILSEISSNENEQIKIIKSAQFLEQIDKVGKSTAAKDVVRALIVNGECLKLKTLNNSPFFYFIKLVVELKIFDEGIGGLVAISLERAYQNLTYSSKDSYSDILHRLLDSSFFNFYFFAKVLVDPVKLHFIIAPLYLDALNSFFEKFMDVISVEYDTIYDRLVSVFREIILDKTGEKVQEVAEEILPDIAANVVEEYSEYINDYKHEFSNSLEEFVWDKLENEIYSKIETEIPEFDARLSIKATDFSVQNMKQSFDIAGALDAVLQEEKDYDSDERPTSGESEYVQIQRMFER